MWLRPAERGFGGRLRSGAGRRARFISVLLLPACAFLDRTVDVYPWGSARDRVQSSMGNCCSTADVAVGGGAGRRVDLSNKNLSVLPESIGADLSVTSLDLSFNALTKLPKRWKRFTSLRSLSLRSNHLLSYAHATTLGGAVWVRCFRSGHPCTRGRARVVLRCRRAVFCFSTWRWV